MPTYTNEPPPEPSGAALPIKRTPAMKALVAIVTSEDLAGTPTHFFKGRTRPCEKEDCEACEQGIPWRWHAYLSAVDADSMLHFLFECTAQASQAFIQYRKAHGTLRGCMFSAKRWKAASNSRVIIQTRPANLEKITLPQSPILPAVLAVLWSLPKGEVSTFGRDPLRDMPALATHTLERGSNGT